MESTIKLGLRGNVAMTKTSLKPTYFPLLFAFLVLLDVVAGSLGWDLLRHSSKPLILLSLFVFFAFNGRRLPRSTYMLMLLALFFSWLGDVFLMYENLSDFYFMLGLGAFLIAHILYISLFIGRWNRKLRGGFVTVLLILLAFGTFLFQQIKEGLGALLFPVILYIVVILLMTLAAFGRKGRVSAISFKFVFSGALFFIASDSILALNKFLFSVPYSPILIMGTYATAQCLITYGILRQNDI